MVGYTVMRGRVCRLEVVVVVVVVVVVEEG